MITAYTTYRPVRLTRLLMLVGTCPVKLFLSNRLQKMQRRSKIATRICWNKGIAHNTYRIWSVVMPPSSGGIGPDNWLLSNNLMKMNRVISIACAMLLKMKSVLSYMCSRLMLELKRPVRLPVNWFLLKWLFIDWKEESVGVWKWSELKYLYWSCNPWPGLKEKC